MVRYKKMKDNWFSTEWPGMNTHLATPGDEYTKDHISPCTAVLMAVTLQCVFWDSNLQIFFEILIWPIFKEHHIWNQYSLTPLSNPIIVSPYIDW